MMVTSEGLYVTEIAMLFPRQGQWTAGDYFALPDSNRIVELVKGELIMAPPPSIDHQRISSVLYRLLYNFVADNKLGEVLYAPLAVQLGDDHYREPDIIFVRQENRDRIKELYIDGPPDWVAEVISPGTRKADEVDKLKEYAQAGIPEYWLVDPDHRTIRVYALHGGDTYILAGTYTEGQTARSETLVGFEVAIDQIFPQPIT